MRKVSKQSAQPTSARNAGFALLVVLWILGTLVLVLLTVMQPLENARDDILLRARQLQARARAESGFAIGLHPEVGRFDAVLNQRTETGDGFRVRIFGENGRFGINTAVQQRQKEALARLLRQLGLPFEESEALTDAIVDWIDADDNRQLNGAEGAEYEALGIVGAPANRAFERVEEMRAVLGMDALEAIRPDWAEFFSTAADFRVDINSAAPETLRAVFELADNQAEAVITARSGPDGQLDTVDDVRIGDFNSFAALAGGFDPVRLRIVRRSAIFESPLRRVLSIGLYSKTEYRMEAVAVPGIPPRILLWEKP